MRRMFWLAAVLMAAVALRTTGSDADAEAHGYLQVDGPQGLQVFVDGESAGTILPDSVPPAVIVRLAAGSHAVRMALPGGRPELVTVAVPADDLVWITSQAAVAPPQVRTSGEAVVPPSRDPFGSIHLITIPVRCRVAVEGMELDDDADKTTPGWQLDDLAAGRYVVTCTADQLEPLRVEVVLAEGERARLLLHLPDGTADHLSERAAKAEWDRTQAGNPRTAGALPIPFSWIPDAGLWIGSREITNAEFRAFRKEHRSGAWQGHDLDVDRQPVCRVSADDAIAFAAWLTRRDRLSGHLPQHWQYRLPTAGEWRAAAMADCAVGWPPTAGNYRDEASGLAEPIAGFRDDAIVSRPVADDAEGMPCTGLGGNVAEWAYPDDPAAIPVHFLACGASWRTRTRAFLEADDRHFRLRAHDRLCDVGFRLALAPAPGVSALTILPPPPSAMVMPGDWAPLPGDGEALPGDGDDGEALPGDGDALPGDPAADAANGAGRGARTVRNPGGTPRRSGARAQRAAGNGGRDGRLRSAAAPGQDPLW